MIISSSNAGIARGRAHIHDNDIDFIDAQIVDEAAMKQLAALILATLGDGPNQANSWGAVEFTVLLPNSRRERVLVNARAAALLESLIAAIQDEQLRESLKGLLDYKNSM